MTSPNSTLLADLEEISTSLILKERDALSRLRKAISDIYLPDIFEELDNKNIIGPLYLLKRIVNDIYSNLATDATFGFPDASDLWVTRILLDLSAELGHFIKITLVDQNVKKDFEYNKAIKHLFDAVKQYFSIITQINKRSPYFDSIDKILSSDTKVNKEGQNDNR